MNFSNIERLEAKIDQIVQEVKELRERNRHLEKLNTELTEKLEDREKLLQSYETEIHQLREKARESNLFSQKSEEIKNKISSMLDKLEQLESMVESDDGNP